MASKARGYFIEFLLFGFKQAWACIFGGSLLFLILVSKYFWQADWPIARYDMLVVGAVLIQVGLLTFRLETLEEAKVILIFHVIGTVMEIFKTHMGSWEYPEPNLIRIGGVPLFSGFMYAAVGSYMARIIRIFNIGYSHYPPRWTTIVLACAIYINFFTHHFIFDIRGVLFLITGALYGRSWIYFTPGHVERRMPILVGFCLVAFFIWLAENLGTFSSTWLYPQQHDSWHLVTFGKMGAWFLLMIISFILVSLIHKPRTVKELTQVFSPSSAWMR